MPNPFNPFDGLSHRVKSKPAPVPPVIPPTRPVVPMTAARFHLFQTRGYYAELKNLAREAKLAEADIRFYFGEDVMVLPTVTPNPRDPNWKPPYQTPTPRLIEDPNDDRYRRRIFNLGNWHVEALADDLKPVYRGKLTPAGRRQFEAPFRRFVLPFVAGHVVGMNAPAAHPSVAHRKVTMYVFEEPAVIASDSTAPTNAAGPYELMENPKSGALLFRAHLRSMTRDQLASFADRVVLPADVEKRKK